MGRPRRLLPALLGAAVAAALLYPLVHYYLTVPHPVRLVDLVVYRDAGRSVLDGHAVYAHVSAPPNSLLFTYPPLAALLCVPLAWLSFDAAAYLWTAATVCATAVICWFGFRPLLARWGRWWPLALGGLTGLMQQMLPMRDEIRFGQVDEFLVVLCLIDCVVLCGPRVGERWSRRGGVLVGLATAVKLTPGVFIVYLFLTGRRRAAATAAATFAVLELVTVAVLPHDAGEFWTDALFHSERLRPNAGTSNQSLRGMILRLVHQSTADTILWVLAVAVVGYVGFVRAARAHRSGDEIAGVALTGLLAVLLSPVAWIHHLVWVPLVIGVIAHDGDNPRDVWLAGLVYAYFGARIPWYGVDLLGTDVPQLVAQIVRDGFGLMAIALLVTLRIRSSAEFPGSLASGVTLRHNAITRAAPTTPAGG